MLSSLKDEFCEADREVYGHLTNGLIANRDIVEKGLYYIYERVVHRLFVAFTEFRDKDEVLFYHNFIKVFRDNFSVYVQSIDIVELIVFITTRIQSTLSSVASLIEFLDYSDHVIDITARELFIIYHIRFKKYTAHDLRILKIDGMFPD